MHVNGISIRVPKTADYSTTDVVRYAQMLAERAPGCRWDLSGLEIGALNRAAKALGIAI